MDWHKILKEEILPLMPEDACLNIVPEGGDLVGAFDWKLKTDPERPNKRSKTIALIITEEVQEDVLAMSPQEQAVIVKKLKGIVSTQLENFDPDHPSAWGDPNPVERWPVTAAVLIG